MPPKSIASTVHSSPLYLCLQNNSEIFSENIWKKPKNIVMDAIVTIFVNI